MKEIQRSLLDYIDNETKTEENYENLFNIICERKILQDKYEMKIILKMISQISKNHHRNSMFSSKINRILKKISNTIRKHFTSYEIFLIFKGSRNIILFLIKENIITINNDIYKKMTNQKSIKTRYHLYFKPELQKYNNQKFRNNSSVDLDERRKIGENDNYICYLIRKDLIDGFTDFVKETNIQLNSEIPISIFETNPLLINKKTTLIEYATFFGSVKIFKYLYSNGIKLTKSLWIYAVHSNNDEFISFLESNRIPPNDESFGEVFKESIKCHHNQLANYIKIYLLEEKYKSKDFLNEIEKSYNSLYFHYYNFFFFPSDLNYQQILYYACKYDYYIIVKIIYQTTSLELNEKFI